MPTDPSLNRREALASIAASTLFAPSLLAQGSDGPFKIAVFEADVTPPIGHPLMGGGVAPAKEIVDRLSIRGVVIVGAERPLVIASIDWCEIRNDAYDAWRTALANAVGTEPVRVLLTSIHQHDTPIADLEAERILEKYNCQGRICDLDFHEKAVRTAAKSIGEAFQNLRPLTHVGMGTARVEGVASNRRYVDKDGKPRHNRMSANRDPAIRDQPEGTVDPLLRALSFWDGDKPVAVLNSYATHPMSHYGKGLVSSDFVGEARRNRQKAEPNIFQIYVSGCSGNVTAGKYNDGSTENRSVLAGRIEKAMAAAWKATKREPLRRLAFYSAQLKLDLREGKGFTLEDLDTRLKKGARPFDQCLAALALSRMVHMREDPTIDVPCINFGRAQYLVLPGESYVEFQLAAQGMRPEDLVMVAGYGECSPGYVPTERAFAENDSNLQEWCWVAPGSEQRMIDAIRKALFG